MVGNVGTFCGRTILYFSISQERTGWAGRTITLKYKLDTFQGACVAVSPADATQTLA
jgi:hypothetical protein